MFIAYLRFSAALTKYLNISSGNSELIFTNTVIGSLISPVVKSYRQAGSENKIVKFSRQIRIYIYERNIRGPTSNIPKLDDGIFAKT
jgi:hypothetical protein